MEKKGEILNQLALICDLLEKMNLNPESRTMIIELKENEFIETFEHIKKKYGRKIDKPEDTFTITIGLVDIIFNKNSV